MTRFDVIAKKHSDNIIDSLLKAPFFISIRYFFYAVIWILVSDIFCTLASDFDLRSLLLNASKGLFFVTVTSFLLFKMLDSYANKICEMSRGGWAENDSATVINTIFDEGGDIVSEGELFKFKKNKAVVYELLALVKKDFYENRGPIYQLSLEPVGTKYRIRLIADALKVTAYADIQKISAGVFMICSIDLSRSDANLYENFFSEEFHDLLGMVGLPSAVLNIANGKIISKNAQFSDCVNLGLSTEKLISSVKLSDESSGVAGAFLMSIINNDGIKEFYRVIKMSPSNNRSIVGIALVKSGNVALVETERKNLSETLLDIIDGSNVIVGAFDSAGRIFYCSKDWVSIFGEGFNVGSNIHALSIYEGNEQWYSAFKSAISLSNSKKKVEMVQDGRFYEISCNEVVTMDGFVLSLQDVTDQNAEREVLLEKAGNLQTINKRILDIQEQERYRISKDLHDDLGHDLLVLKLMAEANSPYEDIIDSVTAALLKLKQICIDLHPGDDHDMSLLSTFVNHVNRINANSDCGVSIAIAGSEPVISYKKKLTVFRVFQEALSNCLKHGDKSSIVVDVVALGSSFSMEIANKYQRGSTVSTPGIGMISMRSRIVDIGGEIEFISDGSFFRVFMKIGAIK